MSTPLDSTERTTFREMLEDVLPVIGVVFVAGPPAIAVAGPWVLLALMLSAPFAVLVAFAVVVLAAVAVVAALAAVVVSPYVLARHLQHVRALRAANREVVAAQPSIARARLLGAHSR
jgi:hypothetical protein